MSRTYGWPEGIPDEDTLKKLLAMNMERSGGAFLAFEDALMFEVVIGKPRKVEREGVYVPDAPERDEKFFESIIEKTAEVVKVCDPDGTLTYANPAFESTYGWKVEDVLGTNIMEYVHEGDIERIARETEDALKSSAESSGPTSNRAVYRFKCADGTYRVMEAMGTYLMDDKNIGGVVLFTRAVSSPKS